MQVDNVCQLQADWRVGRWAGGRAGKAGGLAGKADGQKGKVGGQAGKAGG